METNFRNFDKKHFIRLGSNLVFSMFRFLPLKLIYRDLESKKLRGKLKMLQGNIEIKWRNKKDGFFTYMFEYWKKNIFLKKVTGRKIQKTSVWRFLLTEFRLLDTHTCTKITPKKTQQNHQWPQPHVAKVEGKSIWDIFS